MTTDLVVGMGEIGRPLADLLGMTRTVVTKDLESLDFDGAVDAMHVCYPYGDDFADVTAAYVRAHRPTVTVIHSTVVPGTTKETQRLARERAGESVAVAYSPVRGRHGEMLRDMMRYVKFVQAHDHRSLVLALDCLHSAGFDAVPFSACRSLELAKLIETTYSGLLIAFAQEGERFCEKAGAVWEDVLEFTKEVDYLPRYGFAPGFIGGHCIMPNLDLLDEIRESPIVKAIRESNEACGGEKRADSFRRRPWRL